MKLPVAMLGAALALSGYAHYLQWRQAEELYRLADEAVTMLEDAVAYMATFPAWVEGMAKVKEICEQENSDTALLEMIVENGEPVSAKFRCLNPKIRT